MAGILTVGVAGVAGVAVATTAGAAKAKATTTTTAPSVPTVGKPNTPKPQPLPTKTKVVIGVTAPIEVFSEPEVALMKGEFAKENLDATVQLVSPTATAQLLAQGTVQVALAGISAGTLNAINQGVDVRMIGDPETLSPDDPSGLWINKQFLNAKGMLKKPLPSNFTLSLGNQGFGAVSAYWTEQYLEKNGLTLNNVQNVNLNQPTILTALQNGSVDAGFANDPYAGPLVNDTHVQKVATAGGAAVFETSTGYLDQHRAVVQAVMRALVRTARTYFGPGYRTNTSVMSIISSWLSTPTSTIEESPAVVFLPNMTMTLIKPILQGVQETWIKVGNVLTYTQPLATKSVTDTTVLAAVLKATATTANGGKAKKKGGNG